MKKFILPILVGLLLASCGTSTHIAKRNHRNGYHVSISKKSTPKSTLAKQRNQLEQVRN